MSVLTIVILCFVEVLCSFQDVIGIHHQRIVGIPLTIPSDLSCKNADILVVPCNDSCSLNASGDGVEWQVLVLPQSGLIWGRKVVHLWKYYEIVVMKIYPACFIQYSYVLKSL
jgi:hypothetical protein